MLIDDGLATGSTMRAAVEAVRALGPARIIVAVPVGSPGTCREFAAIRRRHRLRPCPGTFRGGRPVVRRLPADGRRGSSRAVACRVVGTGRQAAVRLFMNFAISRVRSGRHSSIGSAGRIAPGWPRSIRCLGNGRRRQIRALFAASTALGHPLRLQRSGRAHRHSIPGRCPGHEPLRITAPGTVRVDETTQGIAQTLEIIDSNGVSRRGFVSEPRPQPRCWTVSHRASSRRDAVRRRLEPCLQSPLRPSPFPSDRPSGLKPIFMYPSGPAASSSLRLAAAAAGSAHATVRSQKRCTSAVSAHCCSIS